MSASTVADLVADQLHNTATTPGARLLILCPPQTGKTHGARLGMARYLRDAPGRRCTYATYDQRAAFFHTQTVRSLLRTRLARSALRPAAPSQPLDDPPADLVVLDDLVRDHRQAHSAICRSATWSWWTKTVTGHLAADASVVVVMSARHHDDLAGRLIARERTTAEGGPWRLLSLPVWAADTDPLGRPPGAPLRPLSVPTDRPDDWADYWDLLRAHTPPDDWRALYACQPSPPDEKEER